MATRSYGQRFFFIEDEDERQQCQFVYVPLKGEPPRRCERVGIYRIGLTIFLCGRHMPASKPVRATDDRPPEYPDSREESGFSEKSIHGRLLALFIDNAGQVVTYGDIEAEIPQLSNRRIIQTVVSQLRRWTGSHIVSFARIGYKYIGGGEEEK